MYTLRVSLTSEQIEASGRVHARLQSWRLMDAALDSLKESLPKFDPVSSLIKTASINQFYGTNIYSLPAVAHHVANVMGTPDRPDLVETIAAVPTGNGIRRYLSFASKFAHFFIDKDRFPIADKYAVRGLRRHLANREVHLSVDPLPPYGAYVVAHSSLIGLAGLSCSGRELDRYLWLSGLYEEWVGKAKAQINVEARSLFESATSDAALQRDLLVMAGTP